MLHRALHSAAQAPHRRRIYSILLHLRGILLYRQGFVFVTAIKKKPKKVLCDLTPCKTSLCLSLLRLLKFTISLLWLCVCVCVIPHYQGAVLAFIEAVCAGCNFILQAATGGPREVAHDPWQYLGRGGDLVAGNGDGSHSLPLTQEKYADKTLKLIEWWD